MVVRVNRDAREREIHAAALRLMNHVGYRDFSLRSLADELGGSMTLVTHYFPSHADLMASLLEFQLEEFDDDLATLERGADDVSRLRILVDWFLPNTATARASERYRVLMLIQVPRDADWLQPYLDRIEERVLTLLREHVAPLVAIEDRDLATDVLRMTLSGVVLSAVEHPEAWPATRQAQVMDDVLRSLGIGIGIEGVDAARA